MPNRKLLVVIDTQYDFMMVNGKLPVPHAEEMIAPGIRFLAGLDPKVYEAVIFTFDTHEPNIYKDSEEAKAFPIHCVKGSPGWENVFNSSIIPGNIDVFDIEKGVFNMWEEENAHRDNLFTASASEGYFSPDTHEIDIMGVAADYCVLWAIQGFRERGFVVNVLSHLTRGIGRNMTQVILDEFRNDPDVRVRSF